jgi:hypothetical protein
LQGNTKVATTTGPSCVNAQQDDQNMHARNPPEHRWRVLETVVARQSGKGFLALCDKERGRVERAAAEEEHTKPTDCILA